MNKVDRVLKEQNQKNFFTFFVLTIVSLIVAIFQVIAISFLKYNISKNVFIGILIIVVLSNILILFTAFSFFPIFKERNNLSHQKLLKVDFGLIILLMVLAVIFIILIFLLNGINQSLIKAFEEKNTLEITKNINFFTKIRIIKLILDSILILNIISLLSINIFIKNKGGI
ncbi:hypothetical protein V2E25_00330 [Mycoplasmopsis arginini]|uniref:Uncharacterized protein n=1 Tax=Mycoplasmopsis arginini TaxID=2094 RepID=A0ABZ2AJG3_MYCAR|nr:hypothetical protein [Mycoplasmopsis arginini]WVN22038.1 hypothetical protein V2E25_00330 [Mycoplasmopsis arginini]CRH48396.1 Uncharacterised protein [Chlamydia trachomatis]CRH55149.1 Uncharacterised protein [Chlamydia trachomatis]VEU81441.1 Uncharacterised protein [Mycoplasmopsis arginini]